MLAAQGQHQLQSLEGLRRGAGALRSRERIEDSELVRGAHRARGQAARDRDEGGPAASPVTCSARAAEAMPGRRRRRGGAHAWTDRQGRVAGRPGTGGGGSPSTASELDTCPGRAQAGRAAQGARGNRPRPADLLLLTVIC